jgi:hypothetical protein
MSTISKEMLDFAAEAYRILKDDPSDRAVYIRYRRDTERYIEFLMEKQSWYFGKWALFEGSNFVARIGEDLLEESYKKFLEERQQIQEK